MAEQEITSGTPETVGTIIGAVVTIGCYLLIIWPVVRQWVLQLLA